MADASSPLNQFQLWRALLPPALRVLLTVNVATYVLFVALSIFNAGALMEQWLALPGDLATLATRPWTALTWGFTNTYPGFLGLIVFVFGVMWLNMLGRDVEGEGSPETLVGLYVAGILGGTLLAVGVGAVAPSARFFFGVWGPLLAILCYVGVMHPNRPIGLFLIGNVAMKWVAIGAVVLEMAFTKDLSHLGAAIAGTAFAFAERRGVRLGAWAGVFFRDRSPRPERASVSKWDVEVPKRSERRAASAPRRSAASDVDAVLDKISASGMASLTDEERRILDRAGRG